MANGKRKNQLFDDNEPAGEENVVAPDEEEDEPDKPQKQTLRERPQIQKTAFVTGGTGFLGFNLILLLKEQGWNIYAAHRKTSDTRRLKALGVTLVEADITSFASLVVVMPEGLDAIFHVAANTSYWKGNNERQYAENVEGTRNLVNAALQKKAKKFIHTSSVSAYGLHNSRIDENSRTNAYKTGINYCITKHEAEEEVRKGMARGLKAVMLNPAHILGPYDTHNWMQMFLLVHHDNLPGIPPGKGEYTHVKDVAAAHLAAYEKGQLGHNYILGGVQASYREVFNYIQELMGKKKSKRTTPVWVLNFMAWLTGKWSDWVTGEEPPITPEKVKSLTHHASFSSDKAIAELGYNITPIEATIQDTYEWLRKEGYFEREDG